MHHGHAGLHFKDMQHNLLTCSTDIQQKCSKDMQHGNTDCACSMYTCCTEKAAWRNGCMQLVHAQCTSRCPGRTFNLPYGLKRVGIKHYVDSVLKFSPIYISNIKIFQFPYHILWRGPCLCLCPCPCLWPCPRYVHVQYMPMTIFASNMKMLSVIALL